MPMSCIMPICQTQYHGVIEGDSTSVPTLTPMPVETTSYYETQPAGVDVFHGQKPGQLNIGSARNQRPYDSLIRNRRDCGHCGEYPYLKNSIALTRDTGGEIKSIPMSHIRWNSSRGSFERSDGVYRLSEGSVLSFSGNSNSLKVELTCHSDSVQLCSGCHGARNTNAIMLVRLFSTGWIVAIIFET
jgi:hypothetical protein